jgi:tRNA threonylcarbamoyladenosine biosynthesis protein TsaB
LIDKEMAIILAIETATTVCSICISKDGQPLAIKELNEANVHAAMVTVFIEEALAAAGLKLKDMDAVAVSKGPGSYTGLRIGVSAAKGLCYALDKPLIAINTLQALAAKMMAENSSLHSFKNALLCPMLDARRMEVYTTFYDENLNTVRDTAADIIDAESYKDILDKQRVFFFGNGAAKCKSTLEYHPNAVFIDEIEASAQYTALLAHKAYAQQQFEDVAYFEPFYLKDFLFTPAKQK